MQTIADISSEPIQPDEYAERNDMAAFVRSMVGELAGNRRAVIELWLDGLSLVDISAKFKRSRVWAGLMFRDGIKKLSTSKKFRDEFIPPIPIDRFVKPEYCRNGHGRFSGPCSGCTKCVLPIGTPKRVRFAMTCRRYGFGYEHIGHLLGVDAARAKFIVKNGQSLCAKP